MKDTEYFTKVLEEERKKLETELSKLGQQNPNNPEDWDVKKPEIEVSNADPNEAADRTEELHIDSIVMDELELRYRLVLRALQKIEKGAFGTCEICNERIEEDRLSANPAARSCKAHMGEAEKRNL
jgi:RNA polymerase-binding transcription factor DksA